MKKVMVRYKVKKDRVEENEKLVKAVYEQLHQESPKGLRYATFKLADGVSFVHLAVIEGENPLANLPAFKAFQAEIKNRCDEPPAPVDITEIGSYGFFGR